MLNADLKDVVLSRILPNVKTPAQYLGGELNSVAKDHRQVRGKLCLAFPDTYALGMSHHGLQVLYRLMNADPQWACERAFTPLPDFEAALREHGLPLYGLETFTPLARVRRARLQPPVRGLLHERPDDARPRRHPAARRGPRRSTTRWSSPAGPGRRTPSCSPRSSTCSSSATASRACPGVWRSGRRCRASPACRARTCSREIAGERRPGPTSPAFYEPEYHADGTIAAMNRTRDDVPAAIMACVIDRTSTPSRCRPRPSSRSCETPHDRIAIEIMRGCPWQCRFCQSTVIKRPLRVPHRRDDRPGGPGELPQHRLRRDQPALALDQRLPALRGAGHADAARCSRRWA